MRFLRRFKQLYESIISLTIKGDWKIRYNHGNNHDLDKKLSNRTDMSEADFKNAINAILSLIERESLNGDYTFISMSKSAKIVCNINLLDKKIFIVTILGKNEILKKGENFKLI